jgi:hypothetical protein
MADLKVADIEVGKNDSVGVPVEIVYVKKAPAYAIYGTASRVAVHFADDSETKAAQQQLLAALNPLRNEINSLIDGWRASATQDDIALTRLYDRRVADALAAGLENDVAGAQALLKGALDAIAEERQSRGRAEHLRYAAFTVAAVTAIALLVQLIWGPRPPGLESNLTALAYAAAIGALGAVASIGIKVQERSLTTDLQSRDNITDAILRVSVGALGAVLLIAMLRSDLIDIEVGGAEIGPRTGAPVAAPARPDPACGAAPLPRCEAPNPQSPAPVPPASAPAPGAEPADPAAPVNALAATTTGTAQPAPPVANALAPTDDTDEGDPTGTIVDRRSVDALVLLVVAFFAGFAERLVSELATRFRFRDVAAQAAAGAGGPGRPDPRLAGRGGPAGGGSAAQTSGGEEEDESESEDGCVADAQLPEDELTHDSELPETTGGVAEPPRT